MEESQAEQPPPKKQNVTRAAPILFDEEKESVNLRAQLKVKIDINNKLEEDFANFQKTALNNKVDQFAKEGTEEIYEQVIC